MENRETALQDSSSCVCELDAYLADALSRSQFLTDFDEICHRRLEPEKITLLLGSKSNKCIPYFYPILWSPKGPNWHIHNAFFSKGMLKHFSGIVCEPIIAVRSSNDVPWWPPTPEC